MPKTPHNDKPVREQSADYHMAVARSYSDNKHEALRTALHNRNRERIRKLDPFVDQCIAMGSQTYNETLLHAACSGAEQDILFDYIRRGAPMLARTTQQDTPFDNLQSSVYLGDMVQQFIRLVILPAAILEAQSLPPHLRPPFSERHRSPELDDDFYHLNSVLIKLDYVRKVLFPEPTDVARDYRGVAKETLITDPFIRQFMRPLNLSRTWHNPAIGIPQELQPYLTNRHWQPLLNEDFVAHNGYTITCLTNSRALRQEGADLKHCVGKSSYDLACCRNDAWRSHILSVRDPSGRPVSTLELHYHNEEKTYNGDIPVAGTPYRLNIRQHHGAYNNTPPHEAAAVVEEFLAALHDEKNVGRYLAATPNALGEIESLRESNAPGLIEKYIGYTPSWDHIERMFNEFRKPERRASTHYKDGKLVYDDAIDPEDPQRFAHPSHFIDGYVIANARGEVRGRVALDPESLTLRPGEHRVSLRSLNVCDWMNATGIMKQIHEVLYYEAERYKSLYENGYDIRGEQLWTRIARRFRPDTVALTTMAENKNTLEAYKENLHRVEPLSGELSPMPDKPRDRRKSWKEEYARNANQNGYKYTYFDR